MYSRASLDETENPRMWGLSHTFITKFEELTENYGSTKCRDIARVNWQDRNEAKNYYSNPDSSRQDCIKLVGNAAFILGEILDREAEVNNE